MADKTQSIERDGIVVKKLPNSGSDMTEVMISDGDEESYALAGNIIDLDTETMYSDTVVSMVDELVQPELAIVFIDDQGTELACDLNGEWETQPDPDGMFGHYMVKFTDEAQVCDTYYQEMPVEDDATYDGAWVFESVDVREWP